MAGSADNDGAGRIAAAPVLPAAEQDMPVPARGAEKSDLVQPDML